MATPTGIKQIGKPGGLVEPGIQKYGVWDWIEKGVDAYKKYKPLVDTAVSLGKGYLDYKSQKEINELSEQAYKDYMAQKQAATQEAQAAIDLNLMPMEVTNIPTKKADVSSFTAVAARGGLMNLPTRHRKRYYSGTGPQDIEIMDPESLGDFELQKEEGVPIGPMAAFPDTGNPMSNAQQVWESGQIDQGIYQMDFNIFFQSGDWMDYISKEKVQGDMKMASNPEDFMTTDEMQIPQEEIMSMIGAQQAANGGIIGLRHGGRPGYEMGLGPVVGRGMGPEEIETESEWITQKKPDFFEDLFLERKGGGGKDYMVPEEASERADLNEIMIIGGDDMAKAEKIESERSMQGLYTQAIRILDKAWEIDEKLHDEINQTFIDAANDPDVSPANAYYTIIKKYGDILEMKKGGRVKRDNGGIMNLGGLEKDYRTTGGFVPIGAYEKKDDVPARLSKNEFVMTADAVRAAGGGSINKGAQRMYDTMKHLEASPTAKRMTA